MGQRIYLNRSEPQSPLSDMCKAVRRERHITQGQLGKLIGQNACEISFTERGFVPDIDTIIKLVELYKQTQAYQNKILIGR